MMIGRVSGRPTVSYYDAGAVGPGMPGDDPG